MSKPICIFLFFILLGTVNADLIDTATVTVGTDFNGDCLDNIKNCHNGSCESDVDCGGPCSACPTQQSSSGGGGGGGSSGDNNGYKKVVIHINDTEEEPKDAPEKPK